MLSEGKTAIAIGPAGHPLLSALGHDGAARMLSCATERIFAKGDFLCREGQPADVCYLLREGRVALEVHLPNHGGLRVATLHAGDLLGWSWLVPPHRWRLEARALEPVRTWQIDAARLRSLCDEDHEFGYQVLLRFISVMGQRLQATRMKLLDLEARARVGAGGTDH